MKLRSCPHTPDLLSGHAYRLLDIPMNRMAYFAFLLLANMTSTRVSGRVETNLLNAHMFFDDRLDGILRRKLSFSSHCPMQSGAFNLFLFLVIYRTSAHHSGSKAVKKWPAIVENDHAYAVEC